MEEEVLDLEVTDHQTLVETVRTADPKDPFVFETIIREWLGGGFYRSIEATPIPEPDTLARVLA